MARRSDRTVCAGLLEQPRFLLACLGLVLLVRLVWVFAIPNQQVSDYAAYFEYGRAIAAGEGYAVGGRPTAYWPPGQPYFLGAIFSIAGASATVGKLANAMLYIGIVFLGWQLARTLFRSRRIAGVTALILALYPNHICYTGVLLSETPFTFLMLSGTWLLLRAFGSDPSDGAAGLESRGLVQSADEAAELGDLRGIGRPKLEYRMPSSFAGGALFGLAALVKPMGLAVFAVVLGFILCRQARSGGRLSGMPARVRDRSRMAAGLVAVLAVLLVIGLWTARNLHTFGQWIPISTNGGVNLLIGNNPYSTGGYFYDEKVQALIGDLPTEWERDRAATRYALRYIGAHPPRILWLAVRKLFHLYAWDFDGVRWVEKGLAPGTVFWGIRLIAQAVYLAVWVGVVYAIIRRRGALPRLGLAILGVWTLGHLVFFGYARFHYPMVPWLVMYAAAGVSTISSKPIPDRHARSGSEYSEFA